MKVLYTILIVFLTIGAHAQSIDKTTSSITFSADYLGFGSVEGEFEVFDGTINMEESQLPEFVSFSIASSSVASKSKRRTRFLKSEEFFNVMAFPTIDFASTAITSSAFSNVVTGHLTIKDVTEKVSIPFTVNEYAGLVYLKGSLTVNRYDFDIGLNYKEWVIGKDVIIDIICVVPIDRPII